MDEAAARQLFGLAGGSARERGVVPRAGEVPWVAASTGGASLRSAAKALGIASSWLLGVLFRETLLDSLSRLERANKLRLPELPGQRDPQGFDRLMGQLHRTAWVVYAKRPFGGSLGVEDRVANSRSIILSSVGLNASNRQLDARVIQSMLNFVHPTLGGPSTALGVDGMVGTKTVHAINAFQNQQLGFSDGVISPQGQTIKKAGGRVRPQWQRCTQDSRLPDACEAFWVEYQDVGRVRLLARWSRWSRLGQRRYEARCR